MKPAAIAIATWNMEWRPAGSAAAQLMIERLAARRPDIVCLTEAYVDVVQAWGGYQIEAEPGYGYPLVAGRRKVLLWSRRPWADVDTIGGPDLPPGRFVAGKTATALGEINVAGLCIPWRDAHVSTGARDRVPWADHCAYLAGLGSALAQRAGAMIVLGDFNQHLPRRKTPLPVHAALEQAMAPRFTIATCGHLAPEEIAVVDHIAASTELAVSAVQTLSRHDPAGKAISDHWGVSAKVTLRPACAG